MTRTTLRLADPPSRTPAIVGPVSIQPLAVMALLAVSSCRAGGVPEPSGQFYYTDGSLLVMATVLAKMSRAAMAAREFGSIPPALVEEITQILQGWRTPAVDGKHDELYEAVPALAVCVGEDCQRFDGEAVRLLCLAIQLGGRLWNGARYGKAAGPIQLKRFEAAEQAFLDHIGRLIALI